MISIITVTSYSRHKVLPLLYQCIQSQTIQPNEWVIVEGSPTLEEADKNETIIKTNYTASFPIIYIPFEPNTKLGGLRNRGNNKCRGDIIICMDDDDYYPPTRIEHVVERFNENPDILLAGCTNMLLYNYRNWTCYQCKGFSSRHSTNNAMAWRKSYLTNHRHDESKEFGEESSFTNQFSEPMIQLQPIQTVLTSCHAMNTFDKSTVLQSESFRVIPESVLESIIPIPIFAKYQNIFLND